jgi:hypothetical protein
MTDEANLAALNFIHGANSGKVVDADEEAAGLISELDGVKVNLKGMEETQKRILIRLRELIGENKGIRFGKIQYLRIEKDNIQFQQKEFKTAHPDLAKQFTVNKGQITYLQRFGPKLSTELDPE